MRLSLMKAAHVDLSDVAKQEFGYAPVGMTRGEERFQGRRLLSRSRFSSPWVGRRPIYTSVPRLAGTGGMTNLFEGPMPHPLRCLQRLGSKAVSPTFASPTQANGRLDPDFLYAYPSDGSVCGFL
jgi:hypothetical protein